MHKRLQPKKRPKRRTLSSPFSLACQPICLLFKSDFKVTGPQRDDNKLIPFVSAVVSPAADSKSCRCDITSTAVALGESRNTVSTSTWLGLVLLVQTEKELHVIFSPCQELGDDDAENQQQRHVKAPPGCALLLRRSWFFSFCLQCFCLFSIFQNRRLTANDTTVNNNN